MMTALLTEAATAQARVCVGTYDEDITKAMAGNGIAESSLVVIQLTARRG